MKATVWSSVVLEICIFLLYTRFEIIHGEYFEECNGIEDETYISSPNDCRAYIYCNGNDSLLGYCDTGEYFVADESACDYQENVYCPLDAVDEDDNDENTNETDENTEDEEMEITTSPIATTTLRTTTTTTRTTTISTTPSTSIDPLTIPPIIMDFCPTTDDPNHIVLIPSSQSCSDYYLCYHGNAIEMHCSDDLHFNVNTSKCDFPENSHCLIDRPYANKCLPYMTDVFPHPDNCNYFYYCVKGFKTIQQCPFYFGWDYEKRTCVTIATAKCYNKNVIQSFP